MIAPRSPKKIFKASAKPEDFEDIQIQDWVEGIGFVSTHYEERFLRNYGKLLMPHHAPSALYTSGMVETRIKHEVAKAREKVMDEIESWCRKEGDDADEQGDYVVQATFCNVVSKIESLRKQEAQQR